MKSRSSIWMAGLVFVVLTALTIVVFEGRGWSESLGLSEPEPVMVFVIPGIENARRVRSAVSPERIHWEGSAGLAIEGGRVVALSLDDASNVIEEAGWIDRPIQIVRLDDPETTSGERTAGDAASQEARLAKLRSLVNKPMLTRGEQMFVLMAMNDGIEL